MAKSPSQPPGPAPDAPPAPASPHRLQKPDERKEGGPDFGKAEGQAEKQHRDAAAGGQEQHPRLRRKPGRAP
ncbi:hypothetical protein [Sediminicoccus sp. BL-A-41-H5]|uniref:hypothetical protein n=1 Tax=Sediminicoccus sp. BL-A-41-H5 TaxID=3421106 RepID=UPI003D67080D